MRDCGERDLIAAVVERAIADIHADIRDLPLKEREKVRRDAQQWISSNRDKPFSFLWCTDALGLDFQAIRKKLRRGA